ncbi:MAG TPA: SulP family inorganic anion transporter [Quisquiliibacterium sp.]|nr:SulP family inorganic anion transporter [Quisquiliibacterium sp.]HQD82497.1 SulP family inorganic anion transporter [Quisquiliibacterium sp.]HQN12805.1 SulP family inorganic anion transporter [Quisquiliibacterium sp.]
MRPGPVARLLPFLAWPRPTRAVLHADLVAGATVAVVAVPQALAYAQLAGVPPHLGLYAGFVPTIVAALWGSCAQLSTGPVALTALLTAASLAPFAAQGSATWVTLAVLLALMSGLVQWAAGLMRAGRIIERMPSDVILGFVNAAAVMIIVSQLPALLGVPGPGRPGLPAAVQGLLEQAAALHLPTLGFALVSLAVLFGVRAVWPRFPAALVLSVAAILASGALGFERAGGDVVGDLPPGLPMPSWPAADAAQLALLVPAALAIAVVSFVEVLSSSRVISARTGQPWDVDRELIGQGLAKVASGVFGAFPVSASFSRSALNYAARAQSPWASVVCALLVAVALLFATRALHHLPKAVLAAVIISAVVNLLSPREIVTLLRRERSRGLTAMVTFAATLASAPHIHYGLLIGLCVAAAGAWWRDRAE